jgi:hypothetical protein
MPRFSPPAFYGIILAGFVVGIALAAGATWWQVGPRAERPGRDGFDVLRGGYAVLVAVFIGGTFGGLAGVAVAILVEKHRRDKPGGS